MDWVQYPRPETQCRAACNGLQKTLMIEVRWGGINATRIFVFLTTFPKGEYHNKLPEFIMVELD